MPRATRSQIAIAVSLTVFASGAIAQQVQSLDKVEITGHYGNAIGTTDAASAGVINSQLIEDRPLLRPGQLLEYVPRLVVTQQRRRKSQSVFPARLQSRSRHRLRDQR